MTTKVFKTEDERTEAIAALPYEPPEGTEDIDVWLQENNAELEAIANAEIKPDVAGDPLQNNEPSPDPNLNVDPSPTDPPPSDPPPTPSDLDLLTERLREREEALQGAHGEYGTKLKEEAAAREKLVKENEELRKKVEEAAANPPQPKINPEIQLTETKIAELSSELDTSNPDDDPDYLKKLRKVQALQYSLDQKRKVQHDLDMKAHQDLLKATQDNFKKLQEVKSAELEEQKELIKQQAARDNMIKEVEELQKENPELQGKDSYDKMLKDYNFFASNAAAEYFNKPIHEVTTSDKDTAIKAYVEKNPYFLDKFAKSGIKEPASLRQYLLISNVYALKQGYKQQDGKFVDYLNGDGQRVRFPNMKAAYDHYQTINGMTGAKILAAQKEAVENMKAAINQRTDPTEINAPSQSGRVSNQETPEEALKALEMTDEKGNLIFDSEKMGRLIQENPDSPIVKEFNKHLVTLGQEAITAL